MRRRKAYATRGLCLLVLFALGQTHRLARASPKPSPEPSPASVTDTSTASPPRPPSQERSQELAQELAQQPPRPPASPKTAPTAPAEAAPGSHPRQAPVIPPVALHTPSVLLPEGSDEAPRVVCELVVDRLGQVRSVLVIEGLEPFASSAAAVAKEYKFVPATRDGAPVTSRIRMQMVFAKESATDEPEAEEPSETFAQTTEAPSISDASGQSSTPSILPPSLLAAPSSTPEATAPSAMVVDEVHVRALKTVDVTYALSAQEARRMPGAFGDPFRALESLPGVTPMVSGLPLYFVRGAPPGNVGYFLDGMQVPLLHHVGLGPSVVHPALIDRVDYHPGGYPVELGRFAGGMVTAETRGPSERANGEAQVRLFDANALLEVPFAQGRGSVLAAGRTSYAGPALSLVAPDNRLSYGDYQGRGTWAVTPSSTLSLSALGSQDNLWSRHPDTGAFEPVYSGEFHRADLRFDHQGQRDRVRLGLTVGTDWNVFEDRGVFGREARGLRGRMGRVRGGYDYRMNDNLEVRVGGDAEFGTYDVVLLEAAESTTLGNPATPSRKESALGIRGDVVWRMAENVTITPGVRLDRFSAEGRSSRGRVLENLEASAIGVDPRLSVRIGFLRHGTWHSSLGVTHQLPSFFVPMASFRPGSLEDGLQTSVQMAQGLEWTVPGAWSASLTGFLHNYLNMTDLTSTCPARVLDPRIPDAACLADRVRGRTIGAEVLLRRPISQRLSGIVSYTLSRSTRDARPTLGNDWESSAPASRVPSEFDRPSVLNLMAAYDLGVGWRAGSRWLAYSGRPYTRTQAGIPMHPYNAARMPGFHRLDVRVEKAWAVGDRGRLSLVMEGLNVLMQKETIDMVCRPSADSLATLAQGSPDPCRPIEVGPLSLPSIGVEGAF